MKQKKLTITLDEDELGRLAQLAAGNQITPAGQAEQFVAAGLECGDLVHRIEPTAVATLCAAAGNWRAVNIAAGVTCPHCMELQIAAIRELQP